MGEGTGAGARKVAHPAERHGVARFGKWPKEVTEHALSVPGSGVAQQR